MASLEVDSIRSESEQSRPAKPLSFLLLVYLSRCSFSVLSSIFILLALLSSFLTPDKRASNSKDLPWQPVLVNHIYDILHMHNAFPLSSPSSPPPVRPNKIPKDTHTRTSCSSSGDINQTHYQTHTKTDIRYRNAIRIVSPINHPNQERDLDEQPHSYLPTHPSSCENKQRRDEKNRSFSIVVRDKDANERKSEVITAIPPSPSPSPLSPQSQPADRHLHSLPS